jgi:flagellar hook-basal body complex protein FliE
MIVSRSVLTVAAPGQDVFATGDSRQMKAANFTDVLRQTIEATAESLRAGEAAAASGIEGRIPVHETVAKIMAAERQLQMALAVRDKAVSAIQEISRMSI